MSAPTLAARLPDIDVLRRWAQSLAVLDAILSPEWEFRYFSFDSTWDANEQMASMRDGLGDEWSIVFLPTGAYLRGFDHESPMNPFAERPPRPWPGVVDGVPPQFAACVEEAAFSDEGVPRVTVCLWRTRRDPVWRHGEIEFPPGDDPDGADWLFAELDGNPATYAAYAMKYFQRELDVEAIRHVYEHRALNDVVVRALNPDVALADLVDDLRQIGYAVA